MRTLLLLAAVALTMPAFGARHYSYHGRTPSAWTASDAPRAAASTQSAYTTYIGDVHEYEVARIVTDSAGNTYVAGSRSISYSEAAGTLTDVFVSKLDTTGALVFTATIGGKGSDGATAISLDAAGNIYVAGSTSSSNFPIRRALQTAAGRAFLLKLSPDGSSLIYSTYFGGPYGSIISALATDAAGNAYVGGYTWWEDFKSTPGLPTYPPDMLYHVPAFVAKISPVGDRIIYSTLLGGDAASCGSGSTCWLSTRSAYIAGIAVDTAGSLYFAGNTNITDLPVTPGAFLAAGIGPFAGKIKADGTGLDYLTYLSKTQYPSGQAFPANMLNALAVDGEGHAYLGGSTFDTQFPATAGAYQKTFAGPLVAEFPPTSPADGFVLKLAPTGRSIVWATYLGRAQAEDSIRSLVVDPAGNVWAGGVTAAPDFPNTNGWDATGRDFLVELQSSGTALLHASRYPARTASQSVALDAAGMVHFAGMTGIVSALVPGASIAPHIAGIANAAGGTVAGRLVPGELISIYGPGLGPAAPASFQFDSSGLAPKKLGGVEVSVGGLAAPLLYVSRTQINAVVPYGASGDSAAVEVSFSGGVTPAFPVAFAAAAPQIFRKADGTAAAVNQDGTLNSEANPAVGGSIVSIWVTGIPPFQTVDGAVQEAAQDLYCCTAFMEYSDSKLEVVYAGAAPGMVSGVAQINLRLPAAPAYAFTRAVNIGVGILYQPEVRSDTVPIYLVR